MTGDLSAVLAEAAALAVASGELPDGADLSRLPALATGTWRPVPPEAGGGPGSYATTLPFVLARRLAAAPARVAAVLAAALRSVPEEGSHVRLSDVRVTGRGYLCLTVTPGALAGLVARITAAGPGCARSLALDGTRVTAPRDARLASAPDWRVARERLTAEQAGRLAEAAGAEVTWIPARPEEPGPGPAGPVAEAIAYAGEDAVRFALSLLASGVPRPPGPGLDPRAVAAQHLGNPAYAVRYAHAHAASALRQAADLGLPGQDAERFQPCLLAHPSEQVLLDAMSWLPERVAGAARRRQPHVVAAYLEELAGRYFGWQEACPVMGPGSVPPGPPPAGGAPAGGELIQARLQLASAARTVLGTGLRLLGINAPGRM
ncbi:MAG TPA: DALR anticodon-binding domain-containing protein [Streptosporangiaceae bacterium]|jgi:arginyl-tRNA synthetase